MAVGGAKRFDIAAPAITDIDKIAASPGKSRAPQSLDEQQVGHGPGMTAVTVGKRMYGHQPVVEPHGNLVGRVGAEIDPGGNVVA